MDIDANTPGKKVVKMLTIRFFTSDIINSIINILLPVVISVIGIFYNKKETSLYMMIAIIILIILVFNIISVVIRKSQNKHLKHIDLIYNSYFDHLIINQKVIKNIYRLNKTINTHIKSRKPIDKAVFNNFADFQTISFIICESIHNILKRKFGDDINFEVTVFRKLNNKDIRMVAYANKDLTTPSSYGTKFNTKQKDIYFIQIFTDKDAKIACLCNKEEVQMSFKMLEGSTKREQEICQYVGVPIKTDRKEIEFLLQVDTSKEKIFGQNKEEIISFTKKIIHPYAVLLHKAYERDLIFNQYYDMIVKILSVSKQKIIRGCNNETNN